jgi:hypothetical protein
LNNRFDTALRRASPSSRSSTALVPGQILLASGETDNGRAILFMII